MRVNIGPYPDNNSSHDIQIEIHDYDTWNADYTLAQVIYPVLLKLKNPQGCPSICEEDLCDKLKDEYNPDNPYFFKGWKWIIDEMIWSFNEIINNNGPQPRSLRIL